MSQAQKVGQLIMAGGPATTAGRNDIAAMVSRYHVGNVMFTGRSARGAAAVKDLSTALARKATTVATAGVPLFVATDQEGGKVQVLSGPGLSTMPSALTQGSWSTARLRSSAATWGRQLRSAGVNLNLAPVADVVPASMTTSNKPIGFYQREFGHGSTRVSSHVVAFVDGMRDAGVVATAKHFPGLGRVTGNTDTTSSVTDTVTTTSSASLEPFRAAIRAGTPFMMISSAYYSKIDPAHPACFSSAVITGLLRGSMGFDGVVISDDLGKARQVTQWSAGSRAVQFVQAGGDVVLTVLTSQVPAMYSALLDRAERDATFRRQVDAAVLRVLRAKVAAGLLPAS